MIQEAKKLCKSKELKVNLKLSDASELPYGDNYFHAVLSISLLHHLKQPEALKTLKEIYRVLKPAGRCLVSVWYTGSFGEKFVEWKRKQETLLRFYRFYRKEELETLIKEVGFRILDIKISGENQKNLFFVLEK